VKQNSPTPWKAVISILATLLYDVSPIDLVPDVIPILGWLDDGLVTIVMFGFAFASWRKWARAKKERGLESASGSRTSVRRM